MKAEKITYYCPSTKFKQEILNIDNTSSIIPRKGDVIEFEHSWFQVTSINFAPLKSLVTIYMELKVKK